MRLIKKTLSLLILAALLIPLVMIGPVNSESPSEIFIEPDEDAYIDELDTDGNYDTFYLHASSFEDVRKKSYLKFSLPSGQIISACLFAKIGEVGYYGHGDIQAWSTNAYLWDEDTLTWENAPPPVSLLDEDTSGSVGQSDFWDVKSLAEVGGLISIILCLSDSAWYDQGARYYSKEYSNPDYRPCLFVQYIPENPEIPGANIRSPGSGEKLRRFSNVDIIAQIPEVTGEVPYVIYTIDDGSQIEMLQHQSTDRYYSTWYIMEDVGSHLITVKAYYDTLTYVDAITIQVVEDYLAELYFEIDYIIGCAPSWNALAYWATYWDSRAIDLTFQVDDSISTDLCGSKVSETEFWSIEQEFNDHQWTQTQSDISGGDEDSGIYDSKEKWILYGPYIDPSWRSNAMGICCRNPDTCISGTKNPGNEGDLLYGNYIFIAKSACEDYDTAENILDDGSETALLLHETGHSIGIALLIWVDNGDTSYWNEMYDEQENSCRPDRFRDSFSVMAHLSIDNTGFRDHWYYSWDYWASRNLSYYET